MRRLLPVLAVTFLSPLATAQEPANPRVTIPYDGPEIFERLLDHLGVAPLDDSGRLDRDVRPADVIIIVFGETEPLRRLEARPGGLKRLLDQGAALCVASDREFDFIDLATLGWDVRVTSSTLMNAAENFQGLPRCPVIHPAGRREHPIFAGLRGNLATNCPSEFLPVLGPDRPLTVLAGLPAGTSPARGPFPTFLARILAGRPPQVIVGSPASTEERVLLVAGHGVFMNCLMIQDDEVIENRRFALNALRWLRGEEPRRRKYALFYHEGEVRTDFKRPLLAPPGIPLPSAAAINRMIDAVQKEALLQKLIERSLQAEGPKVIVKGIIALATLSVLLLGLKRFFASRHAPEPTPLMVGVPEARATPLLRQQMRELTAGGKLGEPAQALARAWFRDVAQVDPAAKDSGAAYEVQSGFFARRRLARQADAAWKLATATNPPALSSERMLELARTLEDLTVAVLAGELRFRPGGS